MILGCKIMSSKGGMVAIKRSDSKFLVRATLNMTSVHWVYCTVVKPNPLVF